MKQPPPKRHHTAIRKSPIRSRPLWKEQHRQTTRISLRHRRIHRRISRRPTPTPHIHRTRPRRQPPKQGPPPHLSLRHHHKRPHRPEQQDIQVAQMVPNHRPTLRQRARHITLNAQSPHNPPAPAMNPDRSLGPHLRPPNPTIHCSRCQQPTHQQTPYHRSQQPHLDTSRNLAATRGCSACRSSSVRKSIVLNARSIAGALHIFAPIAR